MTLILGSRCPDGVILIADRRVTVGGGRGRELRDKLFQNVDNVVWGAAGNVAYFESFKNRVKIQIQEQGGRVSAIRFLPLIEQAYAELLRAYGGYISGGYLSVVIGTRIGARSELYLVDGMGGHLPISEYQIIGSGAPYGELLLKKLWKSTLTMKQVASLGYFAIMFIERYRLDETVGIGAGRPQVWFLPNNPQAPNSAYGDDLRVRSANEIELDDMAKESERKLEIFDTGFETFLNRS